MSAAGDQYVIAYLTHLAQHRRMSPQTVVAYRRDLTEAQSLLQSATHAFSWEGVSADQIRLFAMRLRQQGRQAHGIARALSALRGLYRFLLREGLASHNPAAGVRAPKAARKLPAVLDVDQAARLVALAGDDWLQTRDRALLELFYSSGIRLSELVGLDIDGLQPGDGTARVWGKGGKQRVVPVGQAAWTALAAWLRIRAPYAAPDQQALFITRRGQRLRARAVQTRVAMWGRVQGLPVAVHPHMLRHACASHVLESSGDLRAVQELLGHAHLSTTQIYTHLDYQHLAKVYDQAHPRAKRAK